MTDTEKTPVHPLKPETCTHLHATITFVQEQEFIVNFTAGEIEEFYENDNSLGLHFDFSCVDCNHMATYNRLDPKVPPAVIARFNEAERHHRDG